MPTPNLTPYRREVLTRLAVLGPLTIDDARDGHPNIMPTLIRLRWAEAVYRGEFIRYRITDAGRAVLSSAEGGPPDSKPKGGE